MVRWTIPIPRTTALLAWPTVQKQQWDRIRFLREESCKMDIIHLAIIVDNRRLKLRKAVDMLLVLPPVELIPPIFLGLHQPFTGHAILSILEGTLICDWREGREVEKEVQIVQSLF